MKAALALALLLAGCATVPTGPATDLQPGDRYVALGSSYAAGAGIGPMKPGTPQRCGRTVNNYPALLSEALHLDLVDASCGGATTAHVLGSWDELPAQIDAVTADTRMVTVTVGGNDLGYMALLFGAACRMRADPAETCPAQELPDEAAYRALEGRMRAIAQEVRRRAPGATLVFVQYIRLMPQDLCPATPIAPQDAAEAATLSRRLAAITARAAEAEGALLLPVDTLSATHTPCDAAPWATGLPAGYAGQSAPWHPTAAGHAAIAKALAELIG